VAKKLPRISEAEWQVMRVLWVDSPRTANEVVDELLPSTDWKPNTIRTLLNRLVGKGAVGFTKEGRAHLYSPVVAEADCVRAAGRSFLERVYGGALMPMLAHFLEEVELEPEELAELRRILDDKEG
jgi:BlaI family penicillinase repressor